MNYNIYHESNQFDYSFNFVNTVGELQTVILQALNIPKSDLLFLMHDDKILGKDYPFTDNLAEKNLFDIHIFVVCDYYRVAEGTKQAYNQWLTTQINNTDLIVANQQLLLYNTNNNLSTPNLNFFTGSSNSTQQSSPPSRVYQNPQFSASQATRGMNPLRATARSSSANTTSTPTSTTSVPMNDNGPITPSNPVTSGSRSRRTGNGFLGNSNASRPTITTFGGNGSNGQIQSMLQSFLSRGNGSGAGSSISSIFDTMMNNNIYDLAVTMTEGPDGSNIGLVATSGIDGGLSGYNQSDFFQRLMSDLEPVPVTLTREGINQLPTFKFSELPVEIKESNTCSVCLEDFGDDDQTRVLLCKHYFHKDCIDRWLTQENVRCPLCRHDNRDELSATHRPTGSTSVVAPALVPGTPFLATVTAESSSAGSDESEYESDEDDDEDDETTSESVEEDEVEIEVEIPADMDQLLDEILDEHFGEDLDEMERELMRNL